MQNYGYKDTIYETNYYFLVQILELVYLILAYLLKYLRAKQLVS